MQQELILKPEEEPQFSSADLPLVSIIIPTYNCATFITLTLDSVVEQNYPRLEVIAIDAGSTDRTLEILQSYAHVRLIAANEKSTYAQINQGIALAQGVYLNILFAGDFYIHRHTLLDMMNCALDHRMPNLVYCGTLLRDGRNEVKFLFRALTLHLLKRGQQPTSLQGCWFKKETFEKIGLFRTDLQLRSGFDFLCRFCLHHSMQFAALRRALTDYDLRWVSARTAGRHFLETLKTVYRHFGIWAMVNWLISQKDVGRFLNLWKRRLSFAFFGKDKKR
jgi:glycosyltransferase involved in cell wall biosynthesis